jgi:hypothetical protein
MVTSLSLTYVGSKATAPAASSVLDRLSTAPAGTTSTAPAAPVTAPAQSPTQAPASAPAK